MNREFNDIGTGVPGPTMTSEAASKALLYKSMYRRMADGTEKQINPFSGSEVWTVPGRKNKPITNDIPKSAKPVEPTVPEGYCAFCEKSYLNTPPEKGRLVERGGKYQYVDRVAPEKLFKTQAAFRRIPNLFEIVTTRYWKMNYGYRMSDRNRKWRDVYLAREDGLHHVLNVIDFKLKAAGRGEDEIAAIPLTEKLERADAFFAGSHELVVARRHYIPDAEWDSQLSSSGELSQAAHCQYFKFTIHAMEDIFSSNRYVRYISVFQNWLRPAGASFDHLHKQLVGLDEWGTSVERELTLAQSHPNLYNEMAVNFAGYNNLVIAENEHAVAFADIGHRYPTVAVYSKSHHIRPSQHTDEELRGFSDLVHAIHAAMGPGISCNEEWYYTPIDAVVPMPWHILVKWRINIPAGFEGGTKIFVNPMPVTEIRDQMVQRLYDLRDKRIVDGFKIAEECPVKPNSLRYNRNGGV